MRSFFIILTMLPAAVVSAQSSEDSVKTVINNLFAAMKNGDADAFRAVFADGVVMQTVAVSKDGNVQVRGEDLNEFAGMVGKLKKDSADERISFETVRVDGPLAIVWTPYNFYRNGTFSHCGVNSFQLVRLGAVWKIQYLIDTRRRAGCRP